MCNSLTVFTTLKEISNCADRGSIQRNALNNWQGVFLGADFIEFEGPLIPFKEMVRAVEHDSDSEFFIYANADILFHKTQVRRLYSSVLDKSLDILEGDFILTGQRIDTLENGAKVLHRPAAMDYFLFKRGMFSDLPKVTMGRAYCDSALVAYCVRKGIPVIDASFAVRVDHQFHDYGHVKGGRDTVWNGEAAMENLRENSLRFFSLNCIDATHTLLPDGTIVKNIRSSFLRRLEVELFYKRGYKWCPRFNQLWNIFTRGGKYWKNPMWDGVESI